MYWVWIRLNVKVNVFSNSYKLVCPVFYCLTVYHIVYASNAKSKFCNGQIQPMHFCRMCGNKSIFTKLCHPLNQLLPQFRQSISAWCQLGFWGKCNIFDLRSTSDLYYCTNRKSLESRSANSNMLITKVTLSRVELYNGLNNIEVCEETMSGALFSIN